MNWFARRNPDSDESQEVQFRFPFSGIRDLLARGSPGWRKDLIIITHRMLIITPANLFSQLLQLLLPHCCYTAPAPVAAPAVVTIFGDKFVSRKMTPHYFGFLVEWTRSRQIPQTSRNDLAEYSRQLCADSTRIAVFQPTSLTRIMRCIYRLTTERTKMIPRSTPLPHFLLKPHHLMPGFISSSSICRYGRKSLCSLSCEAYRCHLPGQILIKSDKTRQN